MDFEIFHIESKEEDYIFLSAKINDLPKLSEEFFNYFFSEQLIFDYFKCLEPENHFIPSKKNYAALYMNLRYFFDDGKGIKEEKAGKIGEYFLSILLLKYFEFECILPKLIYISDQNMPIYGIDTLFYSEKTDLLLFGEAKFSVDIYHGISLINTSLSEYEKQFDDEHRFIVQNKGFSKSSNPNLRKYSSSLEEAIDFKTFIKESNISEIGIPLFICHGKETEKAEIFDKLKLINKRKEIMGLKIKYIVISLPIKEKYQFLEYLKTMLINKSVEYKEAYGKK